MIIYKIVNNINGKIYIGQTIQTLEKRWKSHCSKGGSLSYIKRAIFKYGQNNFSIFEIDRAFSLEELNDKEIYWIEYYKSTDKSIGYNIRVGGNNSKMSEESKEKLRRSHLGKKHSVETRRKLCEMRKNVSQETRNKMSLSRIGKVQSEETISKRRETMKNRKFTDEQKIEFLFAQKKRRYKEAKIDISKLSRDEILKLPTVKEYRKQLNKEKSDRRLYLKGIQKHNNGFQVCIKRKHYGLVKTLEEAIILREKVLKTLDNNTESEV